jgi:putative peptidoglycan lipid II flippase
MKGFRFSLSTRVAGVREALRAFTPLLAGRGAVQISGYLDYFLASFLTAGAVAALGWAQSLYLLPIALFGMSVAAAELPELARQTGKDSQEAMRIRVTRGFEQMVFLTVPSAVVFLAFGFLIIGALFRRGEFGVPDNWLVYLVLVSYSLGLVASTTSRLLNNVFYALGQTRTPARIAIERVLLSAALGVGLMLRLDKVSVNEIFTPSEPGSPLFLGAVGLALGAGFSSWYEVIRLHRALARTLDRVSLPWIRAIKLVGLALLSCLPGLVLWFALRNQPILLLAPIVLLVFGCVYLALTRLAGLAAVGSWLGESKKDRG